MLTENKIRNLPQLTGHDVRTAFAKAHPNIALIKYWGKSSNPVLNEPAVSSLSITLDTLCTETRLSFSSALNQDELWLNGEFDVEKLPRISENLDKLRRIAGIETRCRIESANNFPTGAGLASSASGFAALVAAANRALAMELSNEQQTMMARSMSGSAARSINGGFVKIALANVVEPDPVFGSAYAEQFAHASHWPLEVCVGIVSEEEKAVGSTEGMERSRLTSPFYPAWLAGNDQDIVGAEQAVLTKDFERLAELSEFSCLKMHAMAMGSQPGLMYWRGATVEAIHEIRCLRAAGTPVFFTIDAGPQIKAICAPGYGNQVAEKLIQLPGIQRVIRCGLGDDVLVTD